jgi:MFS family permease
MPGLLKDNYNGRELATVFGIFGPVLGLGGVLGPLIGGGLIGVDVLGLGWRAVFLVNVPVGLAALLVAWRVLPRTTGDRAVRLDAIGAAIVVAAALLLVLPLNEGQSESSHLAGVG